MITILHLSDLHRSAEDPLSNEELVAALVTDRIRYTAWPNPIRAPDVVVVSGDVIQGVGLGHANARAELDAQYVVADEFLGRLADEFLCGDRSRLIIAPGNHDVDWNLAKSAMAVVADNESVKASEAMRIGSYLRWCWKERRFFRIVDKGLYAQRFDAYRAFVKRFYAGTDVERNQFGDSPYSVYPLAEGRIGVASFNSCYGNDCYAFHGAIERVDVAAARKQMNDAGFDLWIAVWHHSVHGVPYRSDYMDIDQVHDMLGLGFRLGLHGHQHKHQVIPAEIRLPQQESMAVVSAGSLCAGPKELPTGYFRQYNIIEIADDLMGARVHVRQMETAHLFSPSHMNAAGGKSHVDVTWSAPLKPAASALNSAGLVLEAERLMNNRDASAAASMLMPLVKGDQSEYARSLFLSAAVAAGLWDEVIRVLQPPRSTEELTAVVSAYDRVQQPDNALKILNQYSELVGMPISLRRNLERRALARKGMSK